MVIFLLNSLWSFSYNSFVKFKRLSFSYNSFVKFYGDKKNGSHNMTPLYPNLCYNEVCYKGNVLYFAVVYVNFSYSLNVIL